MWAQHNADLMPPDLGAFGHQVSLGSGDDDDSGYGSSPLQSLKHVAVKAENFLENALNFLLIQTMVKILTPSEVIVK